MSTKKTGEHTFQIAVIGGGPAGVVAALRARELGADVALVERGAMGGTCTNDGCVPTRVLAHAARLVREYNQFSSYGWQTEPPELDFMGIMQRAQSVVYQVHEKKQLINHLETAGVSVFSQTGETRFTDAHSLALADGRMLKAKQFIICAGGHPRRPTFPGSEHAITINEVWGLKKLPRSLAIVGGAATGCQLATIFSAFGAQVTVLELAPRILGVEDEDVAEALRSAFLSRGVQIVTGIGGVERIEKEGELFRLDYRLGDETRSLQAEGVILSAGWVGNLDGLNLSAAGVAVERGYIRVNDYLQSSAEHIFAAGDITGRMMLVQSAGYDGRAAAENAVLGVGQPYKHLIVPHGGFTDPEYGSVGLTEAQARAQGAEISVAKVPYSDLDRAVIDDHTEGFCKLIVSNVNHRILGAHVVGEQALEVIQLVAAGMASNIWVEQLAELELPYPTYTSIVGLAARLAVMKLGVMPLAAQWQSLAKAPLAEWERRSDNN